MADVQREHGYTGVANRLLEAMIEAGFGERQLRILLVLLRLTYGWRRHTVLLTELQLAARAGGASPNARRASGTFRADLHELVQNRVIVRVETEDRGAFTWAINKDFEQWRTFSTTAGKLASRWDDRPRQAKNAWDSVREYLAQDQATSIEDEWSENRPDEGGEWPGDGPDSGPVAGHSVARSQATNDDFGVDFEGLTASERNRKKEKERVLPPPPERESTPKAEGVDEDSVVRDYALRITAAANHGVDKRWGEQTRPMIYGQSRQLAADLILARIPVEVAVQSIVEQCEQKRGDKPGSIEYFRPGILRSQQVHEQQEFDKSFTAPAQTSGSQPSRIQVNVDNASGYSLAREKSETEMGAEYEAERSKHVLSWAKANTDRYRGIVQAANEEWKDFLDTRTGKRSRDATIALKCAEASGFPAFERWKENRVKPSPPTSSPPNAHENL